jgi:hypothetical protein
MFTRLKRVSRSTKTQRERQSAIAESLFRCRVNATVPEA